MRAWIVGILRRYINSFQKKNFTARFIELFQKKAWTFDEYFYCQKEYHDAHESKGAKQSIVMILSLIAAGSSFFGEYFFLSFLFVLTALHAYFKSSQHMLMTEILQANLMLARLQNDSKSNRSI
jgi:hypothetical protein